MLPCANSSSGTARPVSSDRTTRASGAPGAPDRTPRASGAPDRSRPSAPKPGRTTPVRGGSSAAAASAAARAASSARTAWTCREL